MVYHRAKQTLSLRVIHAHLVVLPSAPIRELRDLTRYRKTLIQERTQEINRLQKVLETATVKLAAVVSDVLGKSGQAMLDALVKGTTDADVLADLALGRLRKKLPELREALDGRVQSHHRLATLAYPGPYSLP